MSPRSDCCVVRNVTDLYEKEMATQEQQEGGMQHEWVKKYEKVTEWVALIFTLSSWSESLPRREWCDASFTPCLGFWLSFLSLSEGMLCTSYVFPSGMVYTDRTCFRKECTTYIFVLLECFASKFFCNIPNTFDMLIDGRYLKCIYYFWVGSRIRKRLFSQIKELICILVPLRLSVQMSW